MKKHFGFKELLSYATPYRGTLLLIMALILCESGVALLNPWLAGLFTESLLTQPAAGTLSLRQILLCWLAVFILQAILSFSNRYLTGRTGESMLAQMRNRLYDHLQSLPIGYYHDRKHGEVLALMTNDVSIISSFVTGTMISLFPHIMTFVGAMVLIFLISPIMALASGLLVPLLFLVMKILGRKIHPVSRAMVDENARTLSIVEENLSLLPLIKSFTSEKIESEKFHEGNLRLLNLTTLYLRIQAILSPVIRLLAAVSILLLLWIASGQVESGQLTTGNLVSLLLYGMMLARPMSGLADVYGQVQRTRGAAQRLIDVFSANPEPDHGEEELLVIRSDIVYRNIHFSYPGRKQVLCSLNLHIKHGETVAIIGENGAGKSTLVHLLMRFADPQHGTIKIDETDIRNVTIASLRHHIGLVQQNVLLLNDTVRENIAFGHAEADTEKVIESARKAHALEFINQLPNGLSTLIGDKGIKLSGGQKQRLALARVLLKNPPILILDEATAMFDPEGEQNFIDQCHDLLNQRTVILITHRPASLAMADRILRMEQGRLSQVY